MEFDFGGYVTRNDLLCADGRTIRKNAFKDQNGQKVPLVWMHQRNDPENVIGHAYLENREDGVYGYCRFNNSPRGKQAKLLVEHGDITSMSIFANNLVQKGGSVTHGMIREVSLVISPANPGALIDNPVVQHGDGQEYEDLTRALICCGSDISFDDVDFEVEHSAETKNVKMKAKKKEKEEEEDDEDKEVEEETEEDTEVDEEPNDDTEEETEVKDEDEIKRKKKVIEHADTDVKSKKETKSEEDDDDEETVQDVYDSMTDKQKKVVAYMIGAALSNQDEDEAEQSDMEGEDFMSRNVFDQNKEMEMSDHTPSLSHDQLTCIFEDAQKCGSLKQSFLAHAHDYGIENIDILFPDAKVVGDNPYMIKRDTEWVAGVLAETTHVPFNRIKSVCADLTADEARAKGYVKGNLKKEEVIKLLKRSTSPTTVYKKQKLDRDDIVDITDLNIVAWLKAEMRVMLNEELARSFLIGDGREVDDPDKINEDNIRPIYKDDDMYAHHIILPADTSDEDVPEEILRAQIEYKGSGNPSLYSTAQIVLNMLLIKDKIGRRLYNTEAELSSALGVGKIVKVPPMERQTRTTDDGKTVELLGILVNLRDYTVGATSGGEVSMFDDFDIDYNQHKYLMETRCCGALTVPKSAIVIEREVSASGASELG